MLKTKIAGTNTIITVFIVMVAFAIRVTPCQGQMFHVLETPTENTFTASSFINDNVGWLADDQGILWQTTDAGVSLEPIFSGKKFLKLYFISALNGFALAEEDAYKTTNGGESWQPLQLGNCSALWIANSNTGFISGSHKIYKTINGGSNWSTFPVEIPPVTDLYFVSESTGIACAADRELYQSIWRTTDGGATWSNVFNEPKYFIYSVWFVNENTGYAAGYYEQAGLGKLPAINKTTNGGLTWENIFRDDGIVNRGETFLDIRFKNEMEGFAVANFSQSVFTTDGGLSWTSARETDTTGLPTYDAGLFVALDGDDAIYIAGKSGNLIKW